MSNSILAAQVRAQVFVNDLREGVNRFFASEKGQGAAEYAGIIVIVAIIVGAVATSVSEVNVGEKVKTALTTILSGSGPAKK